MKKKNKNINQKNIITKNMFSTKEKVYNPNKYIFFIRKRKSYTICNKHDLLKKFIFQFIINRTKQRKKEKIIFFYLPNKRMQQKV